MHVPSDKTFGLLLLVSHYNQCFYEHLCTIFLDKFSTPWGEVLTPMLPFPYLQAHPILGVLQTLLYQPLWFNVLKRTCQPFPEVTVQPDGLLAMPEFGSLTSSLMFTIFHVSQPREVAPHTSLIYISLMIFILICHFYIFLKAWISRFCARF